MSRIQDSFDSQTGDFLLEPGEYEGPLVITRPCVVDGRMSTLWAVSGPVLLVNAAGVIIRNLRVEVTGEASSQEARIAVQTMRPDTVLSNVEVNGGVAGFPNEAPVWDIPPVLSLGAFAAGQANSFSFHLNAPAEARMSCTLEGIRLTPDRLVKGENLLYVEIDGIKDRTILYGEIMVITGVSRRIYIMGKAEAGAPRHRVEPPLIGNPMASPTEVVNPPQDLIVPRVPGIALPAAVKGQRVPAKKLGTVIKAAFEYEETARSLDIDSYVFLLQENGKVRDDNGLIFFGNQAAESGAVRVTSCRGTPLVIVNPDKAESWVSKIAIAFSIYGDNLSENFSLVKDPSIRLLADERDYCRFALSDLSLEKTVVALELYRYKGEWKIHFVGAGYNSGLRKLCESYGIEVE